MDEDALVSTNLVIQGKSGAKHEFDVYYEFEHLNIIHRIAIECKEWKRPVTKGEVGEFYSKIDDLNNISGVMVAKSGYQLGAKQFAEAKGIQLLEEKDLPSITEILTGQIKKAFLPNKKVKGDPFWTLMEIKNGETTGTYYAISNEGKPAVPLFYSRVIAEKFRKKLPDRHRYEVRGISQYQLKAFIAQMKTFGVQATIFYIPFFNNDVMKVPSIIIPVEKLQEEYLYI